MADGPRWLEEKKISLDVPVESGRSLRRFVRLGKVCKFWCVEQQQEEGSSCQLTAEKVQSRHLWAAAGGQPECARQKICFFCLFFVCWKTWLTAKARK